MKLFQRFLLSMSIAAVAVMMVATGAIAQNAIPVWSAYEEVITNQFYNPIAVAAPPNGGVIGDNLFFNAAHLNDRDDGVAVDIPTGFTFDYDGGLYNTINVCVNGWIQIGHHQIPIITNNKYHVFLQNEPNNTIAPFFGDHYYRSLADVGNGFKPSKIQYTISSVPNPSPDPCAAGALLHTFTIEWKDLNINISQPPSSADPNSIASFQIKLIENPLSSDCVPDKRVTIEFHYGPIGAAGNVKTQGSTVGIEDSLGLSHMNALFTSAFQGGIPNRTNTDSLTTCWPPATCLPGRVITFNPVGRGTAAQWGDGDANLTQIDPNAPSNVRANQNLFVTVADADLILASVAQAYPAMDSVEGRNAFHGDANHNGKYTSSDPLLAGFSFYRVTSYDAAYILMYLAAKLPFLPWPIPLPVPSWKETSSNTTSISGITADTKAMRINGNTAIVPLVLHGTVNGPLGLEMKVSSLNNTAMQFIGAEGDVKVMLRANAGTGKVVLAASGIFSDGDVLGYLQFNVANKVPADFELTNVMINDESYGSSRSTIALSGAQSATVSGFNVEQNMPNPFVVSNASQTSIRFNLPVSENVTVRIFDMLGKEVRSLIGGQTFAAGQSEINWDGRDNAGNLVVSGSYYYQFTAGENVQTLKMQVAH